MTDRQPEAPAFCWATELAMTQQPVTLSVTEAREVSAGMQRLHAENTTLQQGYAAARLEIESLQARIKTMAEVRLYELAMAHLDGRMRGRSTEPALPEITEEDRAIRALVGVEQAKRQYYYKVDGCPAENSESPDCICWHDEGTGPCATDDSTLVLWRDAADALVMRAAQPASGLDPELGPMLDFANAGEIAFYDYAVAQHCRATLDILDGKDNGAGACNEPWASVRKRLLSIVELHQPSSASQGQAPAQAAPAAVARPSDRELLAEWDRVSTIAEAGERRLAVMRAVLAKWGAAPTTQPAPQQEAASVDLKTMELAESVGLIGPASRTHDLHAAIQRFHDLICANATIKAAAMAVEVISGVSAHQWDTGYPPLPDFDTVEQHIYGACRRYITQDMLEPIHSLIRETVDADRAVRATADSVLEDAARLDFIERHPEMSLRHHKGRWAFLGFTNYEYDLHQSLREAIDAAMAAQGGK